jgi:hypothetical protein
MVVKPETAGYPVSFQPITCRRMVVNGEPGKDDMGTLPDHSLVVSLRVVQTLLDFSMRAATMYQYRPQPGAPPRTVEKRRRLPRGGE